MFKWCYEDFQSFLRLISFLISLLTRLEVTRLTFLPQICDLPPPHMWTTFTHVTLHKMTGQFSKMKVFSSPNNVLPTSLLKWSDKLLTSLAPSSLITAVVEALKSLALIQQSRRTLGQYQNFHFCQKIWRNL